MDFYLERKFNYCSGSFVLTGLVEAAALPYFGLKIEELSLDEKAEILFLDQGYDLSFVILFIISGWLMFYLKKLYVWKTCEMIAAVLLCIKFDAALICIDKQ